MYEEEGTIGKLLRNVLKPIVQKKPPTTSENMLLLKKASFYSKHSRQLCVDATKSLWHKTSLLGVWRAWPRCSSGGNGWCSHR